MRWFHGQARTQSVTHGQVPCPVQGGEVDVERCLACPWLGRLSTSGGDAISHVRCVPPRSTSTFGSDVRIGVQL
jgi:hypothetical protein